VDLAQTPGPPDFARPYDVAPLGERARARPSVTPDAIGAGGRSIVHAPRGVPGVARSKAPNGVWVEFDGRRWFAAGQAEVFDSAQFSQRGVYHGFTVYTRRGESGSIYIPSVPGLVTPYRVRK
jgi:hypothetical protein